MALLNTTVADLHGMVQQLQNTIAHLSRPPSRADHFQISDDSEDEDYGNGDDDYGAEDYKDNSNEWVK